MKKRIGIWITDLLIAIIVCVVLDWNKPSMILLAMVIGYVGVEVIDYYNNRES